jgi:hypothetical protein
VNLIPFQVFDLDKAEMVEALALPVVCKYKKSGCEHRGNADGIEMEHEEECEFRGGRFLFSV